VTLQEFINYLEEQPNGIKNCEISYIDVSHPMDDISIIINAWDEIQIS
jgi:hypothetical protein